MKAKKTVVVLIAILVAAGVVVLIAHLGRGLDVMGFVTKLHGG
jgi:hypothetical protein